MTAALLNVDALGWCLLIIGACFVLLAELTHSAVDTLARVREMPVPDPRALRVGLDELTPAALGSRPWGVGLLGFAPEPLG